MKKMLFLMLAVLTLSSCARISGEWKINRIQDMVMVASEEAPLPTVSFANGHYHLYCGCNQINGEYSLNGDKLTLKGGMSTKMFCPEVADLEDALVQLMQGEYVVVLEGDVLTLKDQTGMAVLTLVK